MKQPYNGAIYGHGQIVPIGTHAISFVTPTWQVWVSKKRIVPSCTVWRGSKIEIWPGPDLALPDFLTEEPWLQTWECMIHEGSHLKHLKRTLHAGLVNVAVAMINRHLQFIAS